MPTGACQAITRRCSKNSPPARNARFTHSTPRPPKRPNAESLGEQLIHGQAFVDAQTVQCGGLYPGIRRLTDIEKPVKKLILSDPGLGGPMSHRLRKHHHRQNKTEHRRIERIFADTAVQMLAEQQTRSHRRHRQPPRAIGRQGGSEQCGTDNRAAIT